MTRLPPHPRDHVKILCPICSTERDDVPDDFPHRPFCSARCRQVDLANWLGERYRISRPLHANDLQDDDFELN